MKITFVYSIEEGLGLEYLSAVLKQNGHATELVFDPCLFKDNLLQVHFLHRLYDYEDRVVQDIIDSKPGLVAFSLLSDNYQWFKRIATLLKERCDIPIVVGGIHASAVPDVVIQEPFVDYLIVGEGDYAFLYLVEYLEGKRKIQDVPNLWYKSEVSVCNNPLQPLIRDLDTLPFPDKDLFYDKLPGYQNNYFAATSRGCFFDCHFCCHSTYKDEYASHGYYRVRSPENVVQELSQAKEKYKIYSFYFNDDIFGANEKWLEKFTSLYKEQVGLPYSCSVHPSIITKRKVELLKESGCYKVEFGVQTINPSLRKEMCNRNESTERIRNSIELLMGNGIRVYTQSIIAFPGETEEHLKEMVKFYSEIKTSSNFFFWLRYYPRTEIVKIAQDHKMLNEEHIKEIESGEIFGSLGTGGSFSNKMKNKYYTLLVLSGVLPRKMINYYLEDGRIKYLPSFIPRKFCLIFIFLIYRTGEFFLKDLDRKIFRFNREPYRYTKYMKEKIFRPKRKSKEKV